MRGTGALLRLAWRESRFARRRLLLFLSAISLGVAALVATQSFAANLSAGVREQSKALLGADASLSSNRPFPPRTDAFLAGLARARVPVSRVVTFASMAQAPATGAARLAQVRAIDGGFPYYGEIVTRPAGQWPALARGAEALVDPSLLASLGVRVGDSIALGERRFRVAGALEKVPGEVGIGNLFAPRIYIPGRYVAQTQLVRFGSRAQYEAYLRMPDTAAVKALLAAHASAFRAERVRTQTAQQQQEQLDRALERLGSYLGLVGTFALLLGGIGVASAMGAYMAQKRETVATLRCLGATSAQVLAVYLAQAGAMGLAGATLGAAAGAAVQWVLPRLLADLLPVQVVSAVDGRAVLTGIGVGVWVALAFALLPLLATRRVSPLEALRRRLDAAPLPAVRDAWSWGARLLLAASVVLLVTVQLGNARQGAAVAAGIGATLAALWAVAWLVSALLRRARTGVLPYPARQGLANLHRPGSLTRTVVLALGFGVFLLATLYLLQDNLLRPLRPVESGTRANLVLFDVQPDQEAGIRALLATEGVRVLDRVPIVPMRVASINGRTVSQIAPPDSEENRRRGEDAGRGGASRGGGGRRSPEGWALRREYRSTFRDTLVRSEKMVQGRFWRARASTASTASAGKAPPNEVSLEKSIADELNVHLGDAIVWDVQGVRIPTRVTSVREVDWRRLEPNFFAVFPTRVLAGAPATWVELGHAPAESTRVRAQRDVVARYSNVSVIDLTQVQAALDQVLGRVALVIRFLAAFSVATGFVVLLGAVLTSRLQRLRESVLLRTLGATRGQVAAILLSEYLALGLAAAVAGIALSVGAGWALCRWIFEMDFGVPVLPLLALAAATALLAGAVGVLGSREVFRHTPLEALREE
ncbi:MAG: putative rane protein [Gemmatimonadetes bacterium]|nr:putative rane protein [Gemmatimonadota bacterium]